MIIIDALFRISASGRISTIMVTVVQYWRWYSSAYIVCTIYVTLCWHRAVTFTSTYTRSGGSRVVIIEILTLTVRKVDTTPVLHNYKPLLLLQPNMAVGPVFVTQTNPTHHFFNPTQPTDNLIFLTQPNPSMTNIPLHTITNVISQNTSTLNC